MEELTQEQIDQLIQEIIENGTIEVLEFEAVPRGAERTRVTRSRYHYNGKTVEVNSTYINPVTHHAIYDIQTQSKTLL